MDSLGVRDRSLDFQGFFDSLVVSQRVVCPMIPLLEDLVPAHASAASDSLRPIRVLTYAPTHPGSKPLLPNTLLEMFLRELSQEPHKVDTNGFATEQVQAELRRLMAHGGVAIAWELGEPTIPVALAVCEAHRSDSVIHEIDFPMDVLGSIYGRLGREEPFLVITHLSLLGVTDAQRAVVAKKLVEDAAESTMGLCGLTQATILIPISSQAHSPERLALDTMLGGKQILLARDTRNDRKRELWGLKFRAH